MVSQRVYWLALGYEDSNDHEQLRKDPLFGVLAERDELDKPLAGKSTLDVDTTDLPLHGKQKGRFFHCYYDHYCYLPLYVFCGQHVLCARLRPSNSDASAGSLAEIERIIDQIREAWPVVKIMLRGDPGFCRNELMSWCENKRADYVFGLALNQRLRGIIGRQMWEATEQWNQTSKPARVITEFTYQTRRTKKRGWDESGA